MKLKYEEQARKKIYGRHAGGCLDFNWLSINKTCKSLNGEMKRCCMLDGVECPNYRGSEVRTDEV